MFTFVHPHLRRATLFVVALSLALSGLALAASPALAADCRAYHTVKSGETLYRIGLKYNLTWDKIAAANNLKDGNKIQAGQVLCIPASSGGKQPTPAPIPTFSISAVVKDQTVTISAKDFPANSKFDVRMGAYGTRGVNGALVTTIDSGKGGAFAQTFTLPAGLRGADRLALRLESASGYYAYNWFWNNSTN
jgi:murein DD-endopeptidase MepM/ murein hydrolase activator NlpD